MARKVSWWKWLALLVIGVVVVRAGACNGGCRAATLQPDERLAGHFRSLCRIAEDGVRAPEIGVGQLMRYHGDHGPDMLQAFGQTLVKIERIDDDAAHDQRARVARDRLHAPLIECQETWQKFGEAVEASPVASKQLERGVDRLGRTIGIILGEDAALTAWPRAFGLRIDAALAPRRSPSTAR